MVEKISQGMAIPLQITLPKGVVVTALAGLLFLSATRASSEVSFAPKDMGNEKNPSTTKITLHTTPTLKELKRGLSIK